MNNDFSSFVIEIKNKSDVDNIIKYIKNYLNIEKIYEGDSSYYLMDTYWLADQGFWKIKFFYTDCNETKNKNIKKGSIYYGVFIDSSYLNEEFISIVSKFVYELIKIKYNVILDNDIWSDISEESNQLLSSFLLNS